MLEGLNKGWGGAHLSVERAHEFGFFPDALSLMNLENFSENNIRCDNMDFPW